MAKLEEKAIGLGTVTHAGLEESIMKCFEKSGVMQLVRNMENTPHSMETSMPVLLLVNFLCTLGEGNCIIFQKILPSQREVFLKHGGIGVWAMNLKGILR